MFFSGIELGLNYFMNIRKVDYTEKNNKNLLNVNDMRGEGFVFLSTHLDSKLYN